MNISEDELFERFKPQINHFRTEDEVHSFETYGCELDYVKLIAATEPGRIWTLLDVDGALIAANGYHVVNRVSYYVCEVPVAEGDLFECVIVPAEGEPSE